MSFLFIVSVMNIMENKKIARIEVNMLTLVIYPAPSSNEALRLRILFIHNRARRGCPLKFKY